jgi:hypothetical protein
VKICGETNLNYLVAHHKDYDGNKDPALISMPEKRFQKLLKQNKLILLRHNCHTLLHSIARREGGKYRRSKK